MNINSADDASEKTKVFSKAPVGGVSMFGGLNPSSLLKSQNKDELTKSADVSENESDNDMFADITTNPQNERSRVDSSGDIKDTSHQCVDEKTNDSAAIFGPSSTPINVDSPDLTAVGEAPMSTDSKPPTGEVSMFGKGFNITSLLKKNKSPSGEDDTYAGDNKEANDREDKIDTKLITEKEVLQINIGDPADVPKPGLKTVTKSRPKMSARRLPSRAGRKKLEEISVFKDLSSDNIPKQTSETVSDGFETSPSSPLSTSSRSAGIKPPVGGISMFGGFNPTDVLKKKKESIDDGSSILSFFFFKTSVGLKPPNIEIPPTGGLIPADIELVDTGDDGDVSKPSETVSDVCFGMLSEDRSLKTDISSSFFLPALEGGRRALILGLDLVTVLRPGLGTSAGSPILICSTSFSVINLVSILSSLSFASLLSPASVSSSPLGDLFFFSKDVILKPFPNMDTPPVGGLESVDIGTSPTAVKSGLSTLMGVDDGPNIAAESFVFSSTHW